jgi:hypothetical protein
MSCYLRFRTLVLVVVLGMRLTAVFRMLVVGMPVRVGVNRPVAVPMFVLVLQMLVGVGVGGPARMLVLVSVRGLRCHPICIH